MVEYLNKDEQQAPEYNEVHCLDRFIKKVKNELSIGCQIPLNVPNKEVVRIIDEAKKWFYKNYEDSVEEKFLIIDKSYYDLDFFKKNQAAVLPQDVFSVYDLYDIGKEKLTSWSIEGRVDPDFNIDKWIYGDYYKPGMASESLMYYVINESFYDMARQLMINKLSFSFNRLTHVFKFTGELPQNHSVLRVYCRIADCALFEDDYFYRYVVAKTKIQMGRILTTFTYNLPGGVQINGDAIKDEGKEDLESLIEDIKGENCADYFLTS
jgi:hypothetical protein